MEATELELTRLGYKVLTRVCCGVEQALPGETAGCGARPLSARELGGGLK